MEKSVEKENGSVSSWRVTETDPVIVFDVGVENDLIYSSLDDKTNASGSKAAGAAGAATEHASLELGSLGYTNSGERIMREAGMAQANKVDIQAHGRRDKGNTLELEQPIAEITPENCPFFVHQFFSQEKGKFAISDLVWGKVKSHPWWPGQIFDPSDASKLGTKCQKKNALLVAYFWDKTFAWCDESQLKPFFSNFSDFEKQQGPDTFSSAIKSALKEVCRRIDAGTMCSCLNAKSLFKVYPKIENAGVRQGFEYYTVDRGKVVSSLNPRGLVGFVRNLALEPDKGTTNKLLTVMSKYHIKAFHRWLAMVLKKQTEPIIVLAKSVHLPQNTVSHSDEPLPIIPLAQISPSTPGYTPVVNSITQKPKRKRGRPRKVPVELEKVNATTIETSSDLSSKTNTGPHINQSGKRCKVDSPQTPSGKDFNGSDNLQDSSYWSEVSLRLQADAKLVASAAKRPVIVPVVGRKSDECIPTALLLSFSNIFCKVPSDMEIIRIFSQYGALKGDIEKRVEGSQSQVKLAFKKRSDAEKAFGSLRMQNVFGSSLLSYRLVDLPSSDVTDSSEQEMVEVDEENHGLLEEERTEVSGELNPTMLLLSFSNKSGKVPSEMELIRMFSHHGPLKEGGLERELDGTTCTFRIAFKKYSSAQMAFTSLRKQNEFGPSLLSYRLISLPVEASKKSGQEKVKASNKEKHSVLDCVALKTKLVQLSRAVNDNRTEKPVNKAAGLLSAFVQSDAVTDISVQLSRDIIDNRTEKPVNTAAGRLSTVKSDAVTDISVDPSSIARGGSLGDISVAPSSIVQGDDVGDVATSVEPSSSVHTDMTEMSINPSCSIQTTELVVGSPCTIETCEILADPSNSMQGESVAEIPIDSSNTGKIKTVGETLIVSLNVSGKVGGGDEMPIEPLSIGVGKTAGEIPIVKLRTKEDEVGGMGKMLSKSVSTRQEDPLYRIPVDLSSTGQNQETSPKSLDNSKAGKWAMALENSKSAKPKPISSGSILPECPPSRSAISGCNITPPFQRTSPLWQHLESLEPFTKTPQQPHFKKLERYCQEMRDGMAIGLMVTYANLVDSIKKLSFDDDDVAVIEQKCSCFETLEENGFNVDLIRTRLNQILQIKANYARFGLKQAELEKELTKIESKSVSILGLVESNRSEMAILDEQINALTELSCTLVAERDRLLELTVGNGHEISRLKNELSIVSRLQAPAREEFERVLTEPL